MSILTVLLDFFTKTPNKIAQIPAVVEPVAEPIIQPLAAIVTVSKPTIPPRASDAVTGSAFCQANLNNSLEEREVNVLFQFSKGNLPDFLRDFVPVTVTKGSDSITYWVSSDVLSIGSNEDYVRMPMNALTAQAIADQYDCTLPTQKMVDDIWKSAAIKLEPKPFGPPYNAEMMSTARLLWSNDQINKQLVGKNATLLISGIKKDVVLTNHLSPNPKDCIAIYGWILLSSKPIQGLNFFSHSKFYKDYAHGLRFICNKVKVNGNEMKIQDVFSDPKLCDLISYEGVLHFLRYS